MSTDDPTRPLPAPTPSVWPSVGFVDVDAGIRLLTEVLGFVVTAQHHDDAGILVHAEARRSEGGGVMFGSRDRTGDWAALGPQGVYVATPDPATVDAIGARVQDAEGIEVIGPLEDTDFGSHTFSIRDHDGNLWSIGTYLGE